jgi:mono/diheme cytochrome c family protein
VLPQKAEPKHVAIMNANKCATCHSGAAPKGGLTLGKLADLTGDQKLAIIDRITRPAGDPKRMPQGGKVLSVEDQSEIILGFARK